MRDSAKSGSVTRSSIWSRNVFPKGSTDGRNTRPFWLFIVPPGRRIVHEVVDAIRLGLAIDVDAVHAQHLDEQLPFERRPGDVVEVDAVDGSLYHTPMRKSSELRPNACRE